MTNLGFELAWTNASVLGRTDAADVAHSLSAENNSNSNSTK